VPPPVGVEAATLHCIDCGAILKGTVEIKECYCLHCLIRSADDEKENSMAAKGPGPFDYDVGGGFWVSNSRDRRTRS
jgi:hypothetical protein